MQKVTIEDISRQTGLSRGTVSRALNDRPDISAQTKQRVLEACSKLNYIPSHAARSLATGRNYTVAALVGDLQSAYAGALLRGILERAAQDHYVVHVMEAGRTGGIGAKLQTLPATRLDGALIAVPLTVDSLELLRGMLGHRPFVSCLAQPQSPCDVLAPDFTEAGRIAARHLITKGYRDICFFHPADDPTSTQQKAGFLEVCGQNGITGSDLSVAIDGAPDADSALRMIGPRLQRCRGIAASHDLLAIGLMLLCHRQSRSPGQDVAIIGYGNEPAGRHTWPRLTTIDVDAEDIGRRAMETVLQRVTESRFDAPQTTLAAPRLIERESTNLPS